MNYDIDEVKREISLKYNQSISKEFKKLEVE
jgi:hypothetical protein